MGSKQEALVGLITVSAGSNFARLICLILGRAFGLCRTLAACHLAHQVRLDPIQENEAVHQT
jgi:hypothetical protein